MKPHPRAREVHRYVAPRVIMIHGCHQAVYDRLLLAATKGRRTLEAQVLIVLANWAKSQA